MYEDKLLTQLHTINSPSLRTAMERQAESIIPGYDEWFVEVKQIHEQHGHHITPFPVIMYLERYRNWTNHKIRVHLRVPSLNRLVGKYNRLGGF